MTISKALKLLQQGRMARKRGTTKGRYPLGSPEHRWWARGWLEQDEKLRLQH